MENLSRTQKIALALVGVSSVLLMVVLLFPFGKPKLSETDQQTTDKTVDQIPEGGKRSSSYPDINFVQEEREDIRNESTTITLEMDSFTFEKGKVYQKESDARTLSKDEASKVAANFGFSGLPTVLATDNGEKWNWSDNNRSLSINFAFNTISYHDIEAFSKSQSSEITATEATTLALAYLKDKGLDTQYINPVPFVVKFTEVGQYEGNVGSRKEIAHVTFEYAIDQTPLLVTGLPEKVTVSISAGGELVSLEAKHSLPSWKELDEIDLRDVSSVRASLSSGEGVLVESNGAILNDQTLKTVEISDIELALYGKNEKEDLLQPVYILRGLGRTNSNEITKVALYLQAN